MHEKERQKSVLKIIKEGLWHIIDIITLVIGLAIGYSAWVCEYIPHRYYTYIIFITVIWIYRYAEITNRKVERIERKIDEKGYDYGK